MLLYFLPLLILFLLSLHPTSEKVKLIVSFLLMLFLCFGYMTGSDWRNYEEEYNAGFTIRLVEPGYMFITKLFSSTGLNFWVFHIFLKCLSFFSIVFLIFKLTPGKSFYFSLMLWYASFGVFLFINCPFRNMIACGLSAVGFYYYLKNSLVKYYIFCVLALSFHYSGIFLLAVPLLRFDKIRSSFLVIAYVLLIAVFAAGGSGLLNSLLSRFFPVIFESRIDFYLDTLAEGGGSVISFGSIPRFICLYFIIKYRKLLLARKNGILIFDMAYLFLFLSVIYYVFPMLFRLALFFGPFYIVAISKGITFMQEEKRVIMKYVFFLITVVITYTTITRTTSFVPYTNILDNCIKGEFYDYSYRDSYNPTNSPYRPN